MPGKRRGRLTRKTRAQVDIVSDEEQHGAMGEEEKEEEKEEVKEKEEENPTISDLMAILQTHMGQQNAREAKQKQRFDALEHKFQVMQLEFDAKRTLFVQNEEMEPTSSAAQAHVEPAHLAAPQTLPGVVDSLPYSVVLGRDLPVLFDLLEREQSQNCCAALTRAQARKLEETDEILRALPFYNEELELGLGKARKSRKKRRQEKFQRTIGVGESKSEATKETPRYLLENGILYRQQGAALQLVAPQAVYQLLGIRRLRTTPYHPQTDGLTERFNQTLKQMLRKFVNNTGTDWDQWLPYLLFAYREVPQASTGFSPFELLYGHEVRGPLSLLREIWEGGKERGESVNVISYVIQMRERLEKMSELAQTHMIEAQQQQKSWYDKSARRRTFSPGQEVLVLLPSEENKLLAKWQGPVKVLKQLGPTTYQVQSPGHPQSSKVLHINLLKLWVQRPGKDVMLIREVAEEDEVEEQYLPAAGPVPKWDLKHLSHEQRLEVSSICKMNVFQDNPGRTDIVEHDICLKNGATVKRLSYRIPERLLSSLKKEIDLMLSLGIIEVSKSEWCNPVVLVPKKDGSMRFCIDFRYLNSISLFDSYPTPRIDDLLERLGKAQYLTTLDLSKGYWQVPLTVQSRKLTAFRTPWGLFQFTVLPFGLHGAPATFQRLMDQVLRDSSDFAAAYLDDIVIYSSSWKEHMDHLRTVLNHLQAAGLTVNPAKCVFGASQTEYLGHVIGVENCGRRASLLTDLTGSRSPNQIPWNEESLAAFHDVRQALSKNPVLYSPHFDEQFIVQTDASERGLGAVLLQGPVHDRHPVAYISRKLFPREVKYSTVEKEALAIKWALDSFRYYLLGREFTLETDHKALQWLERMKDSNGRITRWYLALQPFRFSIQHIPGKNNVTADYLSRWMDESFEEGGCVMARPHMEAELSISELGRGGAE
ncbi:hypothetical protein WMY93_024207 [Mugilogobius chulae]|uniref:ribonuclease H n=1 Tax=Mugilogobius chulae TaxID=88201 RepID=A0AAW0N3H8_9GOBI